jgi:dTDP-4-dehydrorhamnose 3,5-epimerase
VDRGTDHARYPVRFLPTPVDGAYIVELEPREDDRGFFARAYSDEEFRAAGIVTPVRMANLTYTRWKGTIRGLHYQVPPAGEAKFIRCIRGAAFAAMVDMREDSPTYRRWAGAELTPGNRRALYIPESCAAGAQALADDTEMFYLVSAPYSPDHERGIRYDDPAIGIQWPMPAAHISDKDRAWPPLARSEDSA